jgi:hypothetical protein
MARQHGLASPHAAAATNAIRPNAFAWPETGLPYPQRLYASAKQASYFNSGRGTGLPE